MGGCIHIAEGVVFKTDLKNKMYLFTVFIYSFIHVFIGSAHDTAKVWR